MSFVTEPGPVPPVVESDALLEAEPAATHNPIPGVASANLHRFLLFTDRLGRLPTIALVVYLLALTVLVALVWSAVTESPGVGIPVSLSFLSFAAFDWVFLALLPRRHRSYGPVAPMLLGFGGLRAAFNIVPVFLPLDPLWIGTLVSFINFTLTAFLSDVLWGEPFRLTLTKLTIRSARLRGAPPLRVLHLSDLHMERSSKREAELLKWLSELRPDVILYTGDLLNFSYLDDELARTECVSFLRQLSAPLGVYAVPGTPLVDRPDILAAIRPRVPHIRWLHNETIELEGYPQVQIIGLTCTHDPALDRPHLDRLCAALPRDKFRLLLYHSPDLMPEAVQAQIDLYLCGHTHGGQVRLPLYGALVTSSMYGKRYDMGRYLEGHTTLYVSRGLGMEGKGAPRMRFLCPPEVTLFELRGDAM